MTDLKKKKKDDDRYCSYAPISQGMPRITGNHQKLGDKHRTDYLGEPL